MAHKLPQPDDCFGKLTQALDKMTFTENGCPSWLTSGEARVDASFKLVRGLTRSELEKHMEKILREAESAPPEERAAILVDAILLWASTRDIRGGKGEQHLSEWIFAYLAQKFPETMTALVPLIPHYGSWKDVVAFLEMADLPESVRQALVALVVHQLQEDAKEDAKPSLCAKWAPRPKSAHPGVAKELAAALFPDAKHPAPLYRKLLATLNRKLNTVEIKMCGGQWAQIDPATIPAKCLRVHRLAFMNQTSNKKQRSYEADRKACAENMLKADKLHGRNLQPHEMVGPLMKMRHVADTDLILEKQWEDMCTRLKEEMPTLGKLIPLVDVSGSMSGTPMEVAVALGILLSEIGPFKHRFITFSSNPQWHQLEEDMTLKEKVTCAMSADWGNSTNLQKALELILRACQEAEMSPEEVGKLSMVVFSDMQFDAACGIRQGWYGQQQQQPQQKWETQHEALVRSFAEAGLKSKHKTPYPVPMVIYWNLRGDTRDMPVEADTPGAQLCSGFSPNLLKLFMEGDLDQMTATATSCDTKPAVNPYQTLRKMLDDERYAPVREICMQVGEGLMAGYIAPAPPAPPEEVAELVD